MRGDIKRCLIVCPGNLAEQWQDEMYRKFHLRFEILLLRPLNIASWFHIALVKPMVLVNSVAIYIGRSNNIKRKQARCDGEPVFN